MTLAVLHKSTLGAKYLVIQWWFNWTPTSPVIICFSPSEMKWQLKAFPLIDLFHLSDDKMQTEFLWICVALMSSATFVQLADVCQGTESPCCKPVGPTAPWWCSGLKKLHVSRPINEAQHHPSSKKLGHHSFDLVSLFISLPLSRSLSISLFSVLHTHTHTSKIRHRRPFHLRQSSYIENILRKQDGQSVRKPPFGQDGYIPTLRPISYVRTLFLLLARYCFFNVAHIFAKHAGVASTVEAQKQVFSSRGLKSVPQKLLRHEWRVPETISSKPIAVKTRNMIGYQYAVLAARHHGNWHVSLWLPDAPTGIDGNHSWG